MLIKNFLIIDKKYKKSKFRERDYIFRKGFTLIELVVAIGIFAFATSGILLMFINCAVLDNANRNKSIATIHAEFVMENIMEYMVINDVKSLKTSIDEGEWKWGLNEIAGKLGCLPPYSYPCVLNGEEVQTSWEEESASSLKITVAVSWKDKMHLKDERSRSILLKTLISRRE